MARRRTSVLNPPRSASIGAPSTGRVASGVKSQRRTSSSFMPPSPSTVKVPLSAERMPSSSKNFAGTDTTRRSPTRAASTSRSSMNRRTSASRTPSRSAMSGTVSHSPTRVSSGISWSVTGVSVPHLSRRLVTTATLASPATGDSQTTRRRPSSSRKGRPPWSSPSPGDRAPGCGHPDTCRQPQHSSPHGWTTYTVRSGDTLIGLAATFRTTPRALAVKNGISDARRLWAGSTIQVPARPSATAKAAPRATARATATHTVRAGETLYDIAARYRTTVPAIAKASGISPAPSSSRVSACACRPAPRPPRTPRPRPSRRPGRPAPATWSGPATP